MKRIVRFINIFSYSYIERMDKKQIEETRVIDMETLEVVKQNKRNLMKERRQLERLEQDTTSVDEALESTNKLMKTLQQALLKNYHKLRYLEKKTDPRWVEEKRERDNEWSRTHTRARSYHYKPTGRPRGRPRTILVEN